MKDATGYLRAAIYNRLNGNVINPLTGGAVPVYNRIPSDSTYPLIKVYSVGLNEIDLNQSNYINSYTTRIEVITRYDSDNGGELICNAIMEQLTTLLRDRSNMLKLQGSVFNVYSTTINSINYITEETSSKTIYRGILELNNKIEEL